MRVRILIYIFIFSHNNCNLLTGKKTVVVQRNIMRLHVRVYPRARNITSILDSREKENNRQKEGRRISLKGIDALRHVESTYFIQNSWSKVRLFVRSSLHHICRVVTLTPLGNSSKQTNNMRKKFIFSGEQLFIIYLT